MFTLNNNKNFKKNFTDIKHNLKNIINYINNKTNPEESFWVIDRFEENFAICENRENKEIRIINLLELPENIKEGNVLKLKNNKYEIDLEEEKRIEDRILQKMKNIWND